MSESAKPPAPVEEVVAEPVTEPRFALALPLNPLALPRVLGEALGDLRAIATGMVVLPQLLEALTSIDRRVETLNDEVGRMRRGVDSMDGSVAPLAEEIVATREGIEELGPRLDEMHQALRPLQRIARRARGRRDVDE